MIAGELLRAQLWLRSTSQGDHWPPFEAVGQVLTTSAWQEHRVRLADAIDPLLWDQLEMAYSQLELDLQRFAAVGKLPPYNPLTPSDSASMKKDSYHLGRLRRQLVDGGSGWPDEIAESVMPSFMNVVEALVDGDVRDEAVIGEVQRVANELAELKGEDGGPWLDEINRRLKAPSDDPKDDVAP